MLLKCLRFEVANLAEDEKRYVVKAAIINLSKIQNNDLIDDEKSFFCFQVIFVSMV